MKVNEIFYSIQGESSYAGRPCAFIRMSGCNLRCTYCDTAYAFNEGTEMTIPEILQKIEAFPTRLVLVTGGEPMLQGSIHELFKELLNRNYTVLLETGGHVSLAEVDARVHKIMDIKCPSSGMDRHNDYGNIECLTQRDEVKFVVGGKPDFDWACNLIRRYDIVSRAGEILFSPIHMKLPYADLASWVLSCGLRVRIQLQLHKIIWPDKQRGV
ncbi:MAG: radical SAM protein [Acidobacteria bacterium]|nr:radical SAM protein [Acidobacteriota bacterium]